MLRHPATWLALLVAGQAATLQWVEAGPRVAYQHYLALPAIASSAPGWSLAVVVLQVGAVLLGLGRLRAPLAALLAPLGAWRLVALALAFVLTSATLSRSPSAYAAELVLATCIQSLHLATVLLLAASLHGSRLARVGGLIDRILGPRLAGAPEPAPGGPDRFAWILAGGVVLLTLLLANWSYQRHPHVPDEVVYLLHARYLAAGQLTMPLPPVSEAFNIDLMMSHAGRWFSSVPPGWPFILAIGAFFGVPWLVNPVLGGANILLAYLLLRELYPRRTARLGAILLAASPWHLFMSMNLMTHTATLAAALAASLAVARLRRRPGAGLAVLAGIGIGVVGLIRPLEGLAVAGVLGLWSLAARGRRFRFGPSAVMTAAAIGTGALVLPYNQALMGSPRTFPIMAYTDAVFGRGTNALGFGANRGLPWPGLDPIPGHGPLDVLINANFNLFQVNVELLGWATGSLIVLLLLVLAGRLRGPDWGMVGAIVAVAGIHSLYYFSGGPDFGARYWYLVLVPCLALTARGLEAAESLAGQSEPEGGARPLVGAAALILASLVVFVPWRATDKYFHYRGMRPDIRAVAAQPEMRGSVVLIRGRRHPDFASAAIYNPIDLSAPAPIFAWDQGDDARRALVDHYPDRRFYIMEGPTVTGGGFEMRAGPLDGASLLARRDSLIPW